MEKKRMLLVGGAVCALLLGGCGKKSSSDSSASGSTGSDSSESSSLSGGSSTEDSSTGGSSTGGSSSSGETTAVKAYMAGLAKTSVGNHLYFHYYRGEKKAADYADWDLWLWGYRPNETEGAKFDWTGRTTSSNMLSATGDATPTISAEPTSTSTSRRPITAAGTPKTW